MEITVPRGCLCCSRQWIVAIGMNICPECNSKLIDIEEETKSKEPLLTIELQDETSVPTVYYKGKEINHKTNISFDWDTDTEEYGGLTYAIEHMETGVKYPTANRTERRVKGHAMD